MSNVVKLEEQTRLIKEAREARAKLKIEREAYILDRIMGAPANKGMPAVNGSGQADPNEPSAKFPGGIDDMEIG